MEKIEKQIENLRYREIAEKTVQKLIELDYEEAMEFFRDELDLDEEERRYFEIPEETENEGFTCVDCPYYWTDHDGDIPYCHHEDSYLSPAPCEYDDYYEEEDEYDEYEY